MGPFFDPTLFNISPSMNYDHYGAFLDVKQDMYFVYESADGTSNIVWTWLIDWVNTVFYIEPLNLVVYYDIPITELLNVKSYDNFTALANSSNAFIGGYYTAQIGDSNIYWCNAYVTWEADLMEVLTTYTNYWVPTYASVTNSDASLNNCWYDSILSVGLVSFLPPNVVKYLTSYTLFD